MYKKTGSILLCHGDGVFEVQHNAVGAVDMGIGHHSRIIAGNEHHGSS